VSFCGVAARRKALNGEKPHPTSATEALDVRASRIADEAFELATGPHSNRNLA
jgi:hypothetical protein